MDDDVDIKLDSKWGEMRATLKSWAAGIALIITAAGGALYLVSQAIFALVAILLNYDDVGYGNARARHTRPSIERQQTKETEPRKEEPQVADPRKPIEERSRRNPSIEITDRTVPQTNKVGPPLDITPQVRHAGDVPMIAPVQQGDEQEDNPDKPPPDAFEENGRWYKVVPYECKSFANEPMPYEACSVNPKSPGGRPTIRQ